LGTKLGDRVATLAWNDHRHLEVYFAVTGIGAVCHTVNPRLHADDIAYIINDAQDSIVFYDRAFTALIDTVRGRCPSVRQWICSLRNPDESTANADYEALIGGHSHIFEWPEFNENTASSLCYTSGTTGRPKGVLTSHRSNMLMILAMVAPDVFHLGARDVVLAVAPMFHVASWGFPFAAPMVGAKLVLPGPDMTGAALFRDMDAQQVTIATGVSTVWIGVLEEIARQGRAPSGLQRASIGGSACSAQAIATLEGLGVEVLHSWGMTELSPLGTLNQLKNRNQHMDQAERHALKLKQGRPPFGVDLRIVDDAGAELPWGTDARGRLQAQGHWTIERYFNQQQPAVNAMGWLDTGDIACIDQEGYIQLVDREKDIIKSGGEWISSLELERAASGYQDITDVAAIGVPHARWQERPVLVAVAAPGVVLQESAVLAHVRAQVASWQVPDRLVQVPALPKTGTGKTDKKVLRQQYDTLLTQPSAEIAP
jgi:acyl-CoA synthetase (AMP-forming)/AMP-acid ligase II